VVRVVAHLGRQIEGDREARLTGLQQVPESRVRLLGAAEPGVLAHRPQPLPIHPGIDATREGELSRSTEVPGYIEFDILRSINGLYLDA
jgi:hypothetical protein